MSLSASGKAEQASAWHGLQWVEGYTVEAFVERPLVVSASVRLLQHTPNGTETQFHRM